MFCSEDATIILSLTTIILGTSLSGSIIDKYANASIGNKILTEDDYNLAITVLVFWFLALMATVQYGDFVAPTYVGLTSVNVLMASMIIHDYEIKNEVSTSGPGVTTISTDLNNIAVATILANFVGLLLNIYDMAGSKTFQESMMFFKKGNIIKGSHSFITKGLLGNILS